jgi:NAD(P)H-hydrate epimerase
VKQQAQKHACIIVYKGPTTIVSDGNEIMYVEGGNAGLTKGGTGDTLAGLTVSLLAKNDAMLAACAASFIIKKTAEKLYEEVGTTYNADDVSHSIPSVLSSFNPR